MIWLKWTTCCVFTVFSQVPPPHPPHLPAAMSEFWLISAPGEKTCQQTWDTMMVATSRSVNLSTNNKFNIPDLKVSPALPPTGARAQGPHLGLCHFNSVSSGNALNEESTNSKVLFLMINIRHSSQSCHFVFVYPQFVAHVYVALIKLVGCTCLHIPSHPIQESCIFDAFSIGEAPLIVASNSAMKKYLPPSWCPLLFHICHREWFQKGAN